MNEYKLGKFLPENANKQKKKVVNRKLMNYYYDSTSILIHV